MQKLQQHYAAKLRLLKVKKLLLMLLVTQGGCFFSYYKYPVLEFTILLVINIKNII